MLAIPRSYGAVIGAIALALTLLGFLFAFIAHRELDAIAGSTTEHSQPLSGTLKLTPRKVFLNAGDAVVAECLLTYCGFPGIQAFDGHTVDVRFRDGRIAQVVHQGRVLDVQLARNESIASRRLVWLVAALAGLALIPLAYKLRHRTFREAS